WSGRVPPVRAATFRLDAPRPRRHMRAAPLSKVRRYVMKDARCVRRAFAVALPVILLAAKVWGASFVVSTTADGDDASPGDGTGRTAAGDCTLRAAIEEANALHVSDPDVITLPAGTYKLSQSELHITDDLTINGAGAPTTIIQAAPNARVL